MKRSFRPVHVQIPPVVLRKTIPKTDTTIIIHNNNNRIITRNKATNKTTSTYLRRIQQQQQQQRLEYPTYRYYYCCSNSTPIRSLSIIRFRNSNPNESTNYINYYYRNLSILHTTIDVPIGSSNDNNDGLNNSSSSSSSSRYDDILSSKSDTEWIQFTNEILFDKPVGTLSVDDIITTEHTIRWWTKHVRNILLHNNNRREVLLLSDHHLTNTTTADAIQNSFLLYIRMNDEIRRNQTELLLSHNDNFVHWYNGRYPRSIHLLNAILDSWRIIWIHYVDTQTTKTTTKNSKMKRIYNNNSNNKFSKSNYRNKITTDEFESSTDTQITTILSPYEMYEYLKDRVLLQQQQEQEQQTQKQLEKQTVLVHGPVLNSRSYSILMNAAIYNDTIKNQYYSPIFCEQLLNEMLAITATALSSSSSSSSLSLLPTTTRTTNNNNNNDDSNSDATTTKKTSNITTTDDHPEVEKTDLTGVDCRPDTVTCTIALQSWAKSGRDDASIRAYELFNEIIQLYETNIIMDVPNTVLYNTLLQALVSSNTVQDMERAEHILLQDMIHSRYYQTVIPNTISYRTVIFGWANLNPTRHKIDRQQQNNNDNIYRQKCRNVDRAFQILRSVCDNIATTTVATLSGGGNADEVQIDATFFSKLISELVRTVAVKEKKSGSSNTIGGKSSSDDKMSGSTLWKRNCYRKAEEIYQYMIDLYQRTNNNALYKPEEHTYRAMIILYSKTNRPNKAYEILCQIDDSQLSNEFNGSNELSNPGVGHYRDVFDSYYQYYKRNNQSGSRNNNNKDNRNDDNDDTSEDTSKVVIPIMIDIVQRMIQQATKNGTKINRSLLPDKLMFDHVLECCSNDPIQCEMFLGLLIDYYHQYPVAELKPKSSHFHRVMKSIVVSSSGTTTSSSSTTSSRKESGSENIAQRIEKLFLVMQNIPADKVYSKNENSTTTTTISSASSNVGGMMQPSRYHYSTLIEAYSICNQIDKCWDVFHRAQNDYNNNGNTEAQPDTALYGTLFQALIKIGDGSAATQLLHTMIDEYNSGQNQHAQPTISIINIVLLSILRTKDKRKAVDLALDVFTTITNKEQSLNLQPNERTYSLLLQILQSYKHRSTTTEKTTSIHDNNIDRLNEFRTHCSQQLSKLRNVTKSSNKSY